MTKKLENVLQTLNNQYSKEEIEAVLNRINEQEKPKYGNNTDKVYLNLMKDILENGAIKEDRTGTGTISVFGRQMRFNLSEGFPLLTSKRVPMRLITSELLWFIKGDTNIRYLLEHNNHIWDEWAFDNYTKSDEYTGPDMKDFGRRAAKDEEFAKVLKIEMDKFCERILKQDDFADKWGSIGPAAYGSQWRSFKGPYGETDQLKDVVAQIKVNRDSRRLLIVSWNANQFSKGEALLPPCHYAIQFYVEDGKLSCMFSMRSNDLFLGNPFNIASYALLTHMIAHECGLEVGELVYTGGDVHIYSNHVEQAKEQLSREPRELPTLWLNPEKTSIFDFEMEDIKVEGYNPHPAIKAPVAV